MSKKQKRPKHPHLPNGFGTIRYLGEGRSNPYAVHPPARAAESGDGNGTAGRKYARPKALCYVNSWYVGLAVLTAYKAGTYEPGLELTISKELTASRLQHSDEYLDAFCERMMKNVSLAVQIEQTNEVPTFAKVYEECFAWKFGENAPKKLSDSAKYQFKSAFLHCGDFKEKAMDEITVEDLQLSVNAAAKKYKKSTVSSLFLVIHNVFKYAKNKHYIAEDVSVYLIMPDTTRCEHGVPFSDEEISTLWVHQDDLQDDYGAEMILIMIYSGFRISEYFSLKVDLENKYFQGGIKTVAGKNRCVPIYSGIEDLVKRRIARYGCLFPKNEYAARKAFAGTLERLGLDTTHTAHDTRHTFSSLCERYDIRENDRKRMLGHVCGDVTNDVYGHRTVEDLRAQIEKIEAGVCQG